MASKIVVSDVPAPLKNGADDDRSRQTRLCECLRLDKFRIIRQLFAELTGLDLKILDPDGSPVDDMDVKPCPTEAAPAHLATRTRDDGKHEYIAPLAFDNVTLGSIVITPREDKPSIWTRPEDEAGAATLMYQWIAGITQTCYQEHQLQLRVEELSALYQLSRLLSGHHTLQKVLDTAARSAAEVMKVKAVAIRLLTDNGRELVPRAIYNLSEAYLNKGPVLVDESPILKRALGGEVVYVEDLTKDERTNYREDAEREGIVSILTTGLIFNDRPIGTIRLYTGEKRVFTPFEVNLHKAIAQLLATAIANARLQNRQREARRVKRQVELAADVQRRMLPSKMPDVPGFEVAAQYIPTLELGGDFYDFIKLDGHIGVALGDVVGKGVAASLLMSAVRASLRAYAQDVYDIDEIISRVNIALSRDTLDNEFATLFYGVIDPSTKRLTYCNAGHEPPLLLRKNRITRLDTGGMIVGVDREQLYDKAVIQLQTGDMLFIYTDGMTEAKNFNRQQFGRERIADAMKQAAHLPAAAAIKHILWQLRCFTGLNTNADDTTVVLIKVVG